MRLYRGVRLVATLATLAAPDIVHAQGFGLNEIGTCALSRGFAATSRPCDDASAVYWNPAALTRLTGTVGLVGAAAVALTGDFTHDRTGRVDEGDVPVEVPPHFFLSHTFAGNRRSAIGLGVYVPYGLTSQWSQDFAGRFSAQRASLAPPSTSIFRARRTCFAPAWTRSSRPSQTVWPPTSSRKGSTRFSIICGKIAA